MSSFTKISLPFNNDKCYSLCQRYVCSCDDIDRLVAVERKSGHPKNHLEAIDEAVLTVYAEENAIYSKRTSTRICQNKNLNLKNTYAPYIF